MNDLVTLVIISAASVEHYLAKGDTGDIQGIQDMEYTVPFKYFLTVKPLCIIPVSKLFLLYTLITVINSCHSD